MKRRPAAGRPEPPPPAAGPSAPPLLPPPADWLRPAEPFLVPLLVLLAARALLWATLPVAAEDAYITFRYAKNLAIGNGLQYNPGERVMGFSSPLWTLWCALGWRLTGSALEWARAWGVFADAVTLTVAAGLLRRYAGRAAAWCFAAFFAAWPFFAAVAVSGMETGVVLALLVVAAALAAKRSAWTGPALAALVLSRPEGIAAAAVIALGARGRDRALGLALAAAGVAGLWLYFGHPVPQSVLAKAGIYGHPGPLQARFWWDWLVPFPIGGAPVVTEGVHLFLLSVLMAPAVVRGAPVLWAARRSGLALAAAAALVIWLGYAGLGVAYFFWYLVVPLGGILLLAAAGLPRLVRGPAIYASAALFVVGMWGVGLQLYVGRAKQELQTFGRVADWLAANARPGETVFLEPIGLIGYRNPLVVLDEVGLVSPAVARRRLQGAGWYADILEERRPEWLVVRRSLLTRGAAFAGRWPPLRNAAERDTLRARYEVTGPFAGGSADQDLLVLRRRR